MKHALKATIVAAAAATALLGSAAWAGEVKGSNGGEFKDVNGRSVCAFSGLNDEYYILDQWEAARTQSFGQLVSEGLIDPQAFNDPDVATPTMSCNPVSGTDLHE